MDIIVTTPKSRMMKEAAQEAADCIAAGGGEYFRRFHRKPPVRPLDRVYYVEDGYVRGFAQVSRVEEFDHGFVCATTNRWFSRGWYVFMHATSWKWIKPIPMTGFQGYRLAHYDVQHRFLDVVILGSWLDDKPKTES